MPCTSNVFVYFAWYDFDIVTRNHTQVLRGARPDAPNLGERSIAAPQLRAPPQEPSAEALQASRFSIAPASAGQFMVLS